MNDLKSLFCYFKAVKFLKRNGKGTKKERALLLKKKERSRNAFLKIGKGTRKERVPRKKENYNALVKVEAKFLENIFSL